MSSWAVGDARFDVILGMPRPAQYDKETDYKRRALILKNEVKLQADEKKMEGVSVKAPPMGIKQFLKKLKIKKIFQCSM